MQTIKSEEVSRTLGQADTRPTWTGYLEYSLSPASGITLALCLLLLAGDASAKTLGDFVIREERRVGANNTLFVGDRPGAGYASQAFIQFDDSGMISHLYTGTRCAWPNAAPDLSRMIVYDINGDVPTKVGGVPTKVRKTPRDLAQTRIYTTRCGFLRLPKSDCFQAANFGGLIPTESWSFSSEKSYSPSRLICCQDTTEPFAMAWNRISRTSDPMTSLIFWDK
jgi:hypothetical protein